MAGRPRNLVGAFNSRQHRDRALSAVEEQEMSCHFSVARCFDQSRAIFRSRIWSAVFAAALLSATMVFDASPAFAQKKTGGDCKASFMNKCLADCTKRAGRQCDWFCGRRSSYAC